MTVDYDDHGTPLRITTVVLSTQHDKSVMETKDGEDYFSDAARQEVLDKLIKPVLETDAPRPDQGQDGSDAARRAASTDRLR